MNLTLRQKIIGAVIAVGLLLIALFQMGLGGKVTPPVNEAQLKSQTSKANQDQYEIKIVSTNPSDLLEKRAIIMIPDKTIEITFSQALENEPETRIGFDPKQEFKIELSGDKKTAKIIFTKPLELGGGYTMTIKNETKFQGGKTFGRDENFHLTTINYRGV